MDYGSNNSTLSLTGGDNIDDIADTLLNLATTTSNNQILINDNTILINDVSGSLNTLDIQVQDISGVVDTNIIDIAYNTFLINDVSYNLNTLNIFVQDVSSQVQDISGVVDENILAIDINNLLIDDVSGSLTALLNVVTDLSTNFYNTEHGANIINVSNTLTDLSGSHYALQDVVVDLSTNFYILTGTTIPAINLVITDLSGSHYALENVVVDLSGNVATNVSTIADISGLVQTNIASIVSHNNRITDVEGTLQDLQDELDALDDDGAGGSIFDAIFGAGTVVSLATVATLALNAYNLAVAANATNATQEIAIDALEVSRQIKLVDSQYPLATVQTNEAGIYNITSSGLIDAAQITASSTITSSSTITGNAFSSTDGYAVGETQITPNYIDLYSTTTTISGENVVITGNSAVNINGNINLNGGDITGVNVLTFSGSAIEGLDTLNFKTDTGASASISNLKSVAGDNFSISNGDATFGGKTISTLQTAIQVGALITTAINTLVGTAGSGYDTLKELQDEIENNDVSLNEVFTNVATKVSKSGDTMTGTLGISGGNVGLNVLSTTHGNTHIGGTQSSNYLSSAGGTVMRKHNSPGDYTDIARFFTGGIELKQNTSITGTLTAPVIQGNNTPNIHKIRLWSSTNTYSIGFASGFSYGGLDSYAMTFTMNNTANRGWLFRQDGYTNSQGCMSLTNAGKLTVASNTRIGYGISDTTAPSGAMLDVNGDTEITGDLTVSGDLTADNTFISNWGQTTSPQTGFYASFSHTAVSSTDADVRQKYALMQSNSGYTYLNSNSLGIDFRNNHGRVGLWDATKLEIIGGLDVSGGNLLVESTANPTLTLWGKTPGSAPAIELLRNSATFGADVNYDWRIENSGGTFKLKTEGTFAGYTGLREMISISPTTGNFTIGDNLVPIVLNGDAEITGGLTANDAFIGKWIGGENYAVFCNQSFKTGIINKDNYAIRQGTAGNTIINSKTGQPLDFRIGNANKIRIASDGNVDITNNLDVGGDLTIVDGNLVIEHLAEADFNPYILLNSRRAAEEYDGKSSLFLTEQFADRDHIQGAYIEYDGGSPNSLYIGTQNAPLSGSTATKKNAITIARNSSNVGIVGDLNVGGDTNITGDASVAGVLYLNSDGNINEKFMEWNYYGGRLYEFNSYDNGVDIISKTNGKNMNWKDQLGNGIFTILNTGDGTGNQVISRCPFVIDSPVRADLDMKMVCGSSSFGITENKIYLKSGDDDGGATYLQYQDGTNAVEGVEIYVKDTASSPNRVAQFQNSIIVFFKELYCYSIIKASAYFTLQNVPICNICFGFYQRSVNNTTGLMNHAPTVDNATSNAVKWIAVPFRIKVYAISFSTDVGSYGERDYTFQPRVYPGLTDATKRGSEKKFENIDENHYEKAVFTSEGVFAAGEKIGLGLILSGESGAEICVKLWCYQY